MTGGLRIDSLESGRGSWNGRGTEVLRSLVGSQWWLVVGMVDGGRWMVDGEW